jgi:hypothetical protein
MTTRRGLRIRIALTATATVAVLGPAAAARAEVLYDSTPSTFGIHPTVQDFEASLDESDAVAADDFTVPAGQTWTLQRAFVDGRQPPPPGPNTTDTVNVALFASAGTLAAASPIYSMQLSGVPGTVYPDFTLDLPGVQVLGPGTYWFGAQAVMDFDSNVANVWFWGSVATQRGNKAAYRNPGDGFGSGCTAFAVMNTCVDNVTNPDLSFRLEGTRTAPATPKKKCKKGRKLKKGKCVKKKRKKRK